MYKIGDKIVIDDPRILVDRTDTLCTHALSTLLYYITILEHDWYPVKLGLTTPEGPEHAYMQCVDPEKHYTKDGTVIFGCRRIEWETSI